MLLHTEQAAVQSRAAAHSKNPTNRRDNRTINSWGHPRPPPAPDKSILSICPLLAEARATPRNELMLAFVTSRSNPPIPDLGRSNFESFPKSIQKSGLPVFPL